MWCDGKTILVQTGKMVSLWLEGENNKKLVKQKWI